MLEDTDARLITRACGDIGDSLYPFREIAAELGMTEEAVVERLKSFKSKGMLRRFGAMLRHQVVGFEANGMSVWNVADPDAAKAGRKLAERPEISHCYERPRMPDWPYNIYAMIHGHTEEGVLAVARRIAEDLAADDYDVLFSVREFKKTSMVYR